MMVSSAFTVAVTSVVTTALTACLTVITLRIACATTRAVFLEVGRTVEA